MITNDMHRNARRAAAVAVWVLLLAAPLVSAQREITITRQSGVSLAFKPLTGSSANAANPVVQSDLTAAGVFSFVAPGLGVFVAEGTSSGGKIEGRLAGPDGAVLFSRSYGGPGVRQNAHRFADDIVFAVTGKPGIASGTIAFVSAQSGHKEIYLCDSDGTNTRRVTSDGALCVAPSISADGNYLSYTGYKSGYADIYLVDLLTGSRQRIVNAPGTNSGAAISPDGGRIALTMSYTGNTELYVTGLGGGQGKRLTTTPGVEASPTWSPDGNELIYTGSSGGSPGLFRIRSSGGGARAVATGFGHCTAPSWSPDGGRLAFNVLSGGQKIAVLDFASGQSRIVADGENPEWGADSRHLVFVRGGALVLLDVDSGVTTTLRTGVGRISEPSWTR